MSAGGTSIEHDSISTDSQQFVCMFVHMVVQFVDVSAS